MQMLCVLYKGSGVVVLTSGYLFTVSTFLLKSIDYASDVLISLRSDWPEFNFVSALCEM